MLRRPLLLILALLGLFAAPAARAVAADPARVEVRSARSDPLPGAAGPRARAAGTRTLGPCSWSYFGDPRSVAIGDTIHTGCIGTDGRVLLDQYDLRTNRHRLLTLFRGLEVDDHNNPSLVAFRGRLYAFASEHSGYVFPRSRRSVMRYRIAQDAGAGAWGRPRRVPLGAGCGLGYTYPNPVVARGRLYLFMRGPCWNPYFTSTRDGRRWTRPRTLVVGPPGAGRRVRPYAKYADAPDGSVLMTFSDGHPGSYPNSLYYARLRAGSLYRADGSRIGALRDAPFPLSRLDRVQRYSRRLGRPWPMDIALGADGRPRIVYSSRVGYDDVFRHARFDGSAWRTRPVVRAGGSLFGYRSGGITFNHADPRWVVLTRLIAGRQEIELRFTGDNGRSWSSFQLTRESRGLNFRPVFPRGLADPGLLVVVYVAGSARSFRAYRTVVRMRVEAPPPVAGAPAPPLPTPTPVPTPAPSPAPPVGGGTPAP